MKVHELCHSSALDINRREGFPKVGDKVCPSSIPIGGLEGDVCIGCRVQGVGVVHEVFGPSCCSPLSHERESKCDFLLIIAEDEWIHSEVSSDILQPVVGLGTSSIKLIKVKFDFSGTSRISHVYWGQGTSRCW